MSKKASTRGGGTAGFAVPEMHIHNSCVLHLVHEFIDQHTLRENPQDFPMHQYPFSTPLDSTAFLS